MACFVSHHVAMSYLRDGHIGNKDFGCLLTLGVPQLCMELLVYFFVVDVTLIFAAPKLWCRLNYCYGRLWPGTTSTPLMVSSNFTKLPKLLPCHGIGLALQGRVPCLARVRWLKTEMFNVLPL
jgi:hypothetical protein